MRITGLGENEERRDLDEKQEMEWENEKGEDKDEDEDERKQMSVGYNWYRVQNPYTNRTERCSKPKALL